MSAGTVFSVLTPIGRGAVAVIAVSGPSAVPSVGQFFIAKNRKSLERQALTRIVYGTWRFDGEDLVVCRRDAECVEVHCHGGSQAVSTIASDLKSVGCEEIPWPQWVTRDEPCPLSVEARIALAQAVSTRAALILLDQYHGALRKELTEIAELIRNNSETAMLRLEGLLATADFGLHLTRPWQVVIAGRPNVGKSSLINALVGYRRAIVFDQPGTTRDVVTASTVIDGWPIALSDTAGLHAADEQLEAAGIELARERLAHADLAIWVLDATVVEGDLSAAVEEIDELCLTLPTRRLVVFNKIDRAARVAVPQGVIGTSATAGTGIDQLLAAISSKLVSEVPQAGAAVVFTEGQRAAVEATLQSCRGGAEGGLARLESLLRTGVCGE